MASSRIGRLPETFYRPQRIASQIGEIGADISGPYEGSSQYKREDIYRITSGQDENGHGRDNGPSEEVSYNNFFPKHTENWSRTTVIMFQRQKKKLDSLSDQIHRRTGAVVKRSQILRALIDAFLESEFPTADVLCEKDLRSRLLMRLNNADAEAVLRSS